MGCARRFRTECLSDQTPKMPQESRNEKEMLQTAIRYARKGGGARAAFVWWCCCCGQRISRISVTSVHGPFSMFPSLSELGYILLATTAPHQDILCMQVTYHGSPTV